MQVLVFARVLISEYHGVATPQLFLSYHSFVSINQFLWLAVEGVVVFIIPCINSQLRTTMQACRLT